MASIISPIKPSTSIFRKLLFLETLLNQTDEVSKVSDESVLSGIADGIAKVSGKAEKDIALAFSKVFPDSAYGTNLDQCASDHGIAPRYASLGSTTYLRVVAAPGTQYFKTVNRCSGQDGTVFELDSDFTMGQLGYEYIKVKSLTTGIKTNVKPNSITNMSSPPSGHIAVTNEVTAFGGRDDEEDSIFRVRIKEGSNILAKNTLSSIEQAFMKVNPNILRVYKGGIDNNGKTILKIATQNAASLNQSELDDLMTRAGGFLSLTDNPVWGDGTYGVSLLNMDYQPFDMDFRCDLLNNANPDDVRRSIQINVMKSNDHRFFQPSTQRIEWDNLLEIVKSTAGVRYVPDQFFLPRTDIIVDRYSLPILRGFIMRNMQGQLIQSFSILSPIFYPNDIDINFQSTVARNVI